MFHPMPLVLLAAVIVLGSNVTIKRNYYDRDAYDVYENGERRGTLKRDYYDVGAWRLEHRNHDDDRLNRDDPDRDDDHYPRKRR